MLEKRIDLSAITETWLGSDVDNLAVEELVPPNYEFIRGNRLNKRRGGCWNFV